jgi:hypothetical protein
MITHASAQYPSRAPFEVRDLMGKPGRALDHDRNPSRSYIIRQAFRRMASSTDDTPAGAGPFVDQVDARAITI